MFVDLCSGFGDVNNFPICNTNLNTGTLILVQNIFILTHHSISPATEIHSTFITAAANISFGITGLLLLIIFCIMWDNSVWMSFSIDAFPKLTFLKYFIVKCLCSFHKDPSVKVMPVEKVYVCVKLVKIYFLLYFYIYIFTYMVISLPTYS